METRNSASTLITSWEIQVSEPNGTQHKPWPSWPVAYLIWLCLHLVMFHGRNVQHCMVSVWCWNDCYCAITIQQSIQYGTISGIARLFDRGCIACNGVARNFYGGSKKQSTQIERLKGRAPILSWLGSLGSLPKAWSRAEPWLNAILVHIKSHNACGWSKII